MHVLTMDNSNTLGDIKTSSNTFWLALERLALSQSQVGTPASAWAQSWQQSGLTGQLHVGASKFCWQNLSTLSTPGLVPSHMHRASCRSPVISVNSVNCRACLKTQTQQQSTPFAIHVHIAAGSLLQGCWHCWLTLAGTPHTRSSCPAHAASSSPIPMLTLRSLQNFCAKQALDTPDT